MSLGFAKSPRELTLKEDIGTLTRDDLKEELKEQLDKLRVELFQKLEKLGSDGSVSSAQQAPASSTSGQNKHNDKHARRSNGEITKKGGLGDPPDISMLKLSPEEEELAALTKRGFKRGAEGEFNVAELNLSRSSFRGEQPPGPTAYSRLAEESDGEATSKAAEMYLEGEDERSPDCCIATEDMDPVHPLAQNPGICNWRYSLRQLVDSDRFAYIVTAFVVMNAILIGVETDYSARNLNETLPGSAEFGWFFCWIFTLDVSSKLLSYGCCDFFLGSEWKWNNFDFLVVFLQWFEEAAAYVTSGKGGPNLGFLRILRIARIMRLARLLHLVVELRSMITSICASLKPLAWAMLLFCMLIYVVAVAMTQLANEYRAQAIKIDESDPDLDRYFNTLGTAILSLWECISGGMDWGSVATPLIQDVSPAMAVVFSVYIAFSMLAMMNVITGIFVDNATTSAQQDKEIYVAKSVFRAQRSLRGRGCRCGRCRKPLQAHRYRRQWHSFT